MSGGKRVLTALLVLFPLFQMSYLFASYDPGFRSVAGAAVAIIAMIAYTDVNMKEVKAFKDAAVATAVKS